MSLVGIVGSKANRTSVQLALSWRELGLDTRLLSGPETAGLVRGDVAVGRLDVLPTVDGVEPGLFHLFLLERRGVPVKNPASALLAAHDKLRTARALAGAGLPLPRTGWVRAPEDPLPVHAPLVVKPRFGSWGTDVQRCSTDEEARELLDALAERSWFRRHGALIQELVPGVGLDLRVLVAGGRAVGAAERLAAPGEWRTNVSLGGRKRHAEPDAAARELAVAAASALGCDLVAVDLLLLEGGGYGVLELNAAADFDQDYAFAGRDVYEDVARALSLPLPERRAGRRATPVAR